MFIFSRPIFYKLFNLIYKLSLLGMNRGVAGSLPPRYSGEYVALEYALSKLDNSLARIIVFDVGANKGHWTDLALTFRCNSSINLSLYLFEPSKSCFNFLITKMTNFKDVEIHNLALSDFSGQSEIFYPWAGAGGASLSAEVSKIQGTQCYGIQKELITVTSLDDFCWLHHINRIHFLKIDVEGLELSVLNGAKHLLEARKITYIQIEIGSASIVSKIFLYDFWTLLSEKYLFYLILNHGLVKISYQTDLECFFGASNFLLEMK